MKRHPAFEEYCKKEIKVHHALGMLREYVEYPDRGRECARISQYDAYVALGRSPLMAAVLACQDLEPDKIAENLQAALKIERAAIIERASREEAEGRN